LEEHGKVSLLLNKAACVFARYPALEVSPPHTLLENTLALFCETRLVRSATGVQLPSLTSPRLLRPDFAGTLPDAWKAVQSNQRNRNRDKTNARQDHSRTHHKKQSIFLPFNSGSCLKSERNKERPSRMTDIASVFVKTVNEV